MSRCSSNNGSLCPSSSRCIHIPRICNDHASDLCHTQLTTSFTCHTRNHQRMHAEALLAINTNKNSKASTYVAYPTSIRCPRHGGSSRNTAVKYGTEKLKWCGYLTVKCFLKIFRQNTQTRCPCNVSDMIVSP